MPAKKLKLPKPRVMFRYKDYGLETGKAIMPSRSPLWHSPVAVIPCATGKQARAVVKMHALTRDQRMDAIEQVILNNTEGNTMPSMKLMRFSAEIAKALNLSTP